MSTNPSGAPRWLPPALTLFVIGAASAAEPQTAELDPVIVTATRTAETVDETLAPVSVVTREDFDRRGSLTTIDALRGLPGVEISSSGGRGTQASLFLRGTNPNQTLFLIDGVKVGSATTGTTPFGNLPLAQIERIEVVRGPRSSLYGSEAIGGVVQLFTRRGGGELRPFFSVTAGGYGTAGISGGLSGGGERGRFSVSGNFDQTTGFDACRGAGAPVFAGCFTDEPDSDGYRNQGAAASVGYDLTDWLSLDANWLRAEADVDFDGDFVNESTQVQQVFGARARLQPLANWNIRLSAGRSEDDQDNRNNGAFQTDFNTRRDSLGVQTDVGIGAHSLITLGVDYLRDEVTSTTAYTVDSRDNTGVFGQYQGNFGPFSARASLRYDDNEQFGSHNTGDLALGWDILPALRVVASYGTAFTAPSFNDLYYPASPPFFAGGNPDLVPEQSQSAELAFSGTVAGLGWSLNLFQTDIDDLIVLSPPTYAAENLDSARIRGAELGANGQVLGFDIAAALTLLDPRDTSTGVDRDNLLPRRPEQSFRLDLDRRLGAFDLGTTLYIAGRSYDDVANSVELDGYTLLSLRAAYAFSDALTLQARVENLFDQDYETVAWYNQPGRALYVTLRYEPRL